MKNLMMILSLSLLTQSAFAVEYTCTLERNSQDTFGVSFNANLEKMDEKKELKYTLKLDGAANGLSIASYDDTYKPHKKNEGSIRFTADVTGAELGEGTGCSEAKVVLDDAAASGEGGELSIAYDCDSDGTGPSFYDYDCKVVKHRN